MRPEKEADQPVQAYIGFSYETIIRCKVNATREVAQFANNNDVQRKRSLLGDFKEEMKRESDLFNNALKKFQTLLLQVPSSCELEPSLFKTIEAKIVTKQKTIDMLYASVLHDQRLLPTLNTKAQKEEAQERLKQKINNLQIQLTEIEEWEMVRRIFEREECHNTSKRIALMKPTDDASPAPIDKLPNIAQPLRREPKTRSISMSTLDAALEKEPPRADGIQGFLNRLDEDIKEGKIKPLPSPIPDSSSIKTQSNAPTLPTEKFV